MKQQIEIKNGTLNPGYFGAPLVIVIVWGMDKDVPYVGSVDYQEGISHEIY
jgi:hypothetical protein